MKSNKILLFVLLMINSLSGFAEIIHLNYEIKRKDSTSLTISFSVMADKSGHALIQIPNSGRMISLSKGAIADATGQEGEFQISAAPGKPIAITYVLTKGDGLATSPYYSRPVIQRNYFYFSGNNGLARPVMNDSTNIVVTLAYKGQPNEFFGNSYFIAKEKGRFANTLADLKESIFCAGDYRTRRFDAAGKKFVLALAGNIRTTDDNAFSAITAMLRGKTNSDGNLPFYFCLMLPYEHKTELSKSAGLINSSITLMKGKHSAIALLE